MTGIGHNLGPSMDEGASWRRHCWQQARRELLPTLPLEVLRLRVARAREIGLEYRTYATVRATTGQDIVAFLFSSNALRLFAQRSTLPQDRADRLAQINSCGRIALVHRPLTPELVLVPPIDHAFAAPAPAAIWRQVRRDIRAALHDKRLPAEGVLLIGETAQEREWSGAAALAGYLSADRFFAACTG